MMYMTIQYIPKNKRYNSTKGTIPLNSKEAWLMYPQYRRFVNRTEILQFQNINHLPVEIVNRQMPIVVKPYYNLSSLDGNAKIINDFNELEHFLNKGYFWHKQYTGKTGSFQIVIVNGEIKWHCYFHKSMRIEYNETESIGCYKLEKVHIENKELLPVIKDYCKIMLNNFTGIVSIDIVDDIIIDTHLHMTYLSLIIDDVLQRSIINLYSNSVWQLPDNYTLDRFCVVFFDEIKDIKNIVKKYSKYITWYHVTQNPLESYKIMLGGESKTKMSKIYSRCLV